MARLQDEAAQEGAGDREKGRGQGGRGCWEGERELGEGAGAAGWGRGRRGEAAEGRGEARGRGCAELAGPLPAAEPASGVARLNARTGPAAARRPLLRPAWGGARVAGRSRTGTAASPHASEEGGHVRRKRTKQKTTQGREKGASRAFNGFLGLRKRRKAHVPRKGAVLKRHLPSAGGAAVSLAGPGGAGRWEQLRPPRAGRVPPPSRRCACPRVCTRGASAPRRCTSTSLRGLGTKGRRASPGTRLRPRWRRIQSG